MSPERMDTSKPIPGRPMEPSPNRVRPSMDALVTITGLAATQADEIGRLRAELREVGVALQRWASEKADLATKNDRLRDWVKWHAFQLVETDGPGVENEHWHCIDCGREVERDHGAHKRDCPIPALLGGAPPAGDALLSPREAMRPDERAAHQRGLDRMARKRSRGDAP